MVLTFSCRPLTSQCDICGGESGSTVRDTSFIPASIIPPLSHSQIILTEGQVGECWKLANKPVFFRLSGSTGD